MTHPSSPPAPMTAERLAEIRHFAMSDYCRDSTAIDDLLTHIDALTSRVSRLLEAVEGAEKALETVKAIETYTRRDGSLFYSNAGDVAREALATLRAAREVKP